MKEQFHSEPREIKTHECDGENCHNKADRDQEYTVTLKRPKITRVWRFCGLECLRNWAGPSRKIQHELMTRKRQGAHHRPITTHDASSKIPRIA
jgi:hypothetical protein